MIHCDTDNELGTCCTTFMGMQEELKKSLSAQWNMTQERVERAEALTHDLKIPGCFSRIRCNYL